jgi:zinc protease
VTAKLADEPLGQVVTLEDDVQLPRVYMGFRLPAFGEPEWYSADLLSTALTGGKASPLYRRLVYEQQIAQDVNAFVLPTELACSFLIVATGRPDTRPVDLEAVILEQLDLVAAGKLDEDDIERSRNKLTTSFVDQLQAVDDRADLLSMFTTYFGEPQRIETEMTRYLDCQPEDLVAVAGHRLTPEKAVTLRVIPR